MPRVNPLLACVNTPVVVPPSATQFVVGAGEVPQQVPRAIIEPPRLADVTVAPSVAVVLPILVTVGADIDGVKGSTAMTAMLLVTDGAAL